MPQGILPPASRYLKSFNQITRHLIVFKVYLTSDCHNMTLLGLNFAIELRKKDCLIVNSLNYGIFDYVHVSVVFGYRWIQGWRKVV